MVIDRCRRLCFAALAVASLSSAACSKPGVGRCNSSKDCATGQTCLGGHCQSHSLCSGGAKTCTTAADCGGGGKICAPGASSVMCCTDAPACDLSSPCPSGLVCQNGVCGAPASCTVDSDCTATASTPKCDTSSMTCVQCLKTSDCPADSASGSMVCTQGSCVVPVPAGCTSDSQCSGSTPHCHAANQECVACLADSDCSGAAAPHCDAQAFVCVPANTSCMADADCSAPTAKCDTSVRPGRCVSCVTDIDCPVDASGKAQTCAASRTCVTKTGCASNADCASATPVCAPSHACVQCLSDANCGVGSKTHCDSNTNTCVTPPVTGCTTDASCTDAANPKCNTAVSPHACVNCLADVDCSPTQACTSNLCVTRPGCSGHPAMCTGAAAFCYAATNSCVACLKDTDCASGQSCSASKACVTSTTGCTGDAACMTSPSTPHCSIVSGHGTCVQCIANAQCSSGTCNTTAFTCVGCGTDAECTTAGTAHCNTTSHTCVACTADTQCATPTAHCDTAGSSTCVACTTDAQCGTGKKCVSNACVLTPPPDCATSGCPSGSVCDSTDTPHACVQCLTNANCSGAKPVCDAGTHTCQAQGTGGLAQPCGTNGACASGLRCIADSATTQFCRAACDPYQNNCASGHGCAFVDFDVSGAPRGACLAEPTGAVGAGGDCTTASCQAELLCVPDSATTGKCRAPCDPNGSSCAATCTAIHAGDDGKGAFYDLGLCGPASRWGTTCSGPGTGTGGCDAGQLCAANPLLTDGAVYIDVCQYPITDPTNPAVGARSPGYSPCAGNSDCSSGLCLNGGLTCDGACTYISDCTDPTTKAGYAATGTTCVDYPLVASNGVTSNVNVVSDCLPECKNDAGCAALGNDVNGNPRTCRLSPTHLRSRWTSYCYFTAGAGKAGAACSSDSDCASARCITGGGAAPTDGICAGTCQKPTDCATGTTCETCTGSSCEVSVVGVAEPLTVTDSTGATSTYWGRAAICSGKTCAHDADCKASGNGGADRVCAPEFQTTHSSGQFSYLWTTCATDADCKHTLPNNLHDWCDTTIGKCAGQDFVLGCNPVQGNGNAGEQCATGSDCKSNTCWDANNNSKPVCVDGCTADADCATGTHCKSSPYKNVAFRLCY